VLTISKVDNKPPDDDSSTVISVAQARMIKNNLLVTSDYHRVLIFCDKDKEGNICGLNETNFHAETANALLKTFEEPPSNTTFFFLTKDKSDMISTIISRAQSFFVPSTKDENRDFALVKDLMDWYMEIERAQVLEFIDKVLALTKENDALEVFTQMQNYLYCTLSFPPPYLPPIETAKKQLKLNMNINTIVENLAFSLILTAND
jgi:DNA polymerase III delta prime subunit